MLETNRSESYILFLPLEYLLRDTCIADNFTHYKSTSAVLYSSFCSNIQVTKVRKCNTRRNLRVLYITVAPLCFDTFCWFNIQGSVCVQKRLEVSTEEQSTNFIIHHDIITSQATLSQAINLLSKEGKSSYFKGGEVLMFNQVQVQGSPSDTSPGCQGKATSKRLALSFLDKGREPRSHEVLPLLCLSPSKS